MWRNKNQDPEGSNTVDWPVMMNNMLIHANGYVKDGSIILLHRFIGQLVIKLQITRSLLTGGVGMYTGSIYILARLLIGLTKPMIGKTLQLYQIKSG